MIEKKDAPPIKIILALGGLLAMLIGGVIFVRTVYNRSFAQEHSQLRRSENLAFPQPQPGHFTAASLAKLRADENADLERYRWNTPDQSEASVPVERALEIYEAQHDR